MTLYFVLADLLWNMTNKWVMFFTVVCLRQSGTNLFAWTAQFVNKYMICVLKAFTANDDVLFTLFGTCIMTRYLSNHFASKLI